MADRQPASRPIAIVGVASGLGARDHGCAAGPDALRDSGLMARLQHRGLHVGWEETLYPAAAGQDVLTTVRDLCERLAQKVATVLLHGAVPLVLGGDHSCAIGTWSGVRRFLGEAGPLGLIWIDAHMDSHTPATSPSGALHGMPLACLLGYGEPSLTGPHAKLLPQHVCLIGVHSFEPEEAELLARLGVRIYFMEEIGQRGLEAVMAEALARVQQGTAGFGISIDLDAINPRESPGIGSPAPGGLHRHDLAHALQLANGNAALLAVELMEYNPQHDPQRRTALAAAELLAALFAPATTGASRHSPGG